jgi:hypothetical protein
MLRWLGKARSEQEPASFVLFVPGKPGLKGSEDSASSRPQHVPRPPKGAHFFGETE